MFQLPHSTFWEMSDWQTIRQPDCQTVILLMEDGNARTNKHPADYASIGGDRTEEGLHLASCSNSNCQWISESVNQCQWITMVMSWWTSFQQAELNKLQKTKKVSRKSEKKFVSAASMAPAFLNSALLSTNSTLPQRQSLTQNTRAFRATLA